VDITIVIANLKAFANRIVAQGTRRKAQGNVSFLNGRFGSLKI
jgi:hypothetical protein